MRAMPGTQRSQGASFSCPALHSLKTTAPVAFTPRASAGGGFTSLLLRIRLPAFPAFALSSSFAPPPPLSSSPASASPAPLQCPSPSAPSGSYLRVPGPIGSECRSCPTQPSPPSTALQPLCTRQPPPSANGPGICTPYAPACLPACGPLRRGGRISAQPVAHGCRFSCEVFGSLIAVIYIWDAIRLLVGMFPSYELLTPFHTASEAAAALLSILLAVGTLWLSTLLSGATSWHVLFKVLRTVIADYGVAASVVIFTLVQFFPLWDEYPVDRLQVRVDTGSAKRAGGRRPDVPAASARGIEWREESAPCRAPLTNVRCDTPLPPPPAAVALASASCSSGGAS